MAKRELQMFSAAESAEVWDRWQRGERLRLIGRVRPVVGSDCSPGRKGSLRHSASRQECYSSGGEGLEPRQLPSLILVNNLLPPSGAGS